MNKFAVRLTLFLCFIAVSSCRPQLPVKYNLKALLKQNKLIIPLNQKVTLINDDAKDAVSVTGIVWLRGVSFLTGSIDVDIRGKDVFQQSFVGIAFHGADTETYDCVYFRPFNFQSADTLRRKHTVQYISEPKYPWDKLRADHPLVFENAVNPFPMPNDWFHARIVVTENEIIVYVNQSTTPSLKVKKLDDRGDGLIGLWSSALSGDFANLVIRPESYSK